MAVDEAQPQSGAAHLHGETAVDVDDSYLARASERPGANSARTGARAGPRKKGVSTNLLSRFTFPFRQSASAPASASATTPSPSVRPPMHNEHYEAPTSANNALLSRPPIISRKRKGSLRKTALLGPGRTKPDLPPMDFSPDDAIDDTVNSPPSTSHYHHHHQRRLSLVSEHSPNTSPPPPAPAHAPAPPPVAQPDLASPVLSPTSQSYASTTDDDDLSIAASLDHAALATNTGSYFGAQPGLEVLRRRPSQKHAPSPLSAVPVLDYNAEDGYDYAETERWGWVVLVVTWVFFTVGMGSCLGVWSWAWDVGQTPYAPPELEDDPTLPIVGYYPALIILTAVMAWVWVVVAWVGMKYFKHAKIQVDD